MSLFPYFPLIHFFIFSKLSFLLINWAVFKSLLLHYFFLDFRFLFFLFIIVQKFNPKLYDLLFIIVSLIPLFIWLLIILHFLFLKLLLPLFLLFKLISGLSLSKEISLRFPLWSLLCWRWFLKFSLTILTFKVSWLIFLIAISIIIFIAISIVIFIAMSSIALVVIISSSLILLILFRFVS